jgi:hypothetical protein
MADTAWSVKVVLVVERRLLEPATVLQRLRQYEVTLLADVADALAVEEPLHEATIFARIATPPDQIEVYPKLLLTCPSVADRGETLFERMRLARDAMVSELGTLAALEGWAVVRTASKLYGDVVAI